jgi:hypothetical protein
MFIFALNTNKFNNSKAFSLATNRAYLLWQD